MLSTGYQVDRYVVEKKLGEGGMAVVYRVQHNTLHTKHALKVLSITNKDVRERLIQEGRVQATLRHPNIVAVTDVLDVRGAPGLLMEYVQGPALDTWLWYYKPTLDEALTVFRGIVAGVGYAHAKGLIHRDLKPANVMMATDEAGIRPKVTDFGLAKATGNDSMKRTRTGTTMGTPAYMAPEQIRDASSVDRRADIYSLGVILYELVCHRAPFLSEDIIELFSNVANGNYPHPKDLRPDLPDHVVDAIVAMMVIDPQKRVADCATILEMLDGHPRPDVQLPPLKAELPAPRPVPTVHSTIAPGTGAAIATDEMIERARSDVQEAGDSGTWMESMPAQGSGTLAQTRTTHGSSTTKVAAGLAAFGAMGVLGLGLLVVGAGGLYYAFGPGAAETAETPAETEAPEPAKEEPKPKPDTGIPDKPAAAEPPPAGEAEVTPEPEPAPKPKAQPAPKPQPKPKPAPVKVVKKPEPAPEPAKPTTGRFTFTGAQDVVFVDSKGTQFSSRNSLPPGNYTVKANFEGNYVGAGDAVIRAGEVTELECMGAMLRCKLK